ncbi:MAG TPA: SPFH domain-containing protein [Gemmatimonadaceae bacterium]
MRTPRRMVRERELKAMPGLLVALILFAAAIAAVVGLIRAGNNQQPGLVALLVIVLIVVVYSFAGLFVVNPNEAKVVTLFGRYVGTEKRAGLWFTNPFTRRRRISLRVRNFETTKLKVNDRNSNPIEIAAIVVWKVVETAEAAFEVDNYEQYVQVQSEAALRTLATHYPYDAHEEHEIALSTHIDEVSKTLAEALHERLAKAGVEVIEAGISHLAYAPEIAAAMLRRQQASAIIAARRKIVEGAVGMVENALALLGEKQVVTLDESHKAQMVSNLLVVLCSDRDAQPVVNAGTIQA